MAAALLRSATDADAEAIADTYLASRRAFLEYAPLAHTDAEVRRWIAEVVMRRADVTVATRGGEVVGFIATRDDGGVRWIDHLYLGPGAVGQGIGAALLAGALAALERPVMLYTFLHNRGARRFYERHGFRAIDFGDGSGNEERCPDALYELR